MKTFKITNAFTDFFSELELNNRKEWFDNNKKRYEADVRKPFQALVQEILEHVSVLNPSLADLHPKDCIFRINRDIRFSKDKTPYKTYAAAAFAPGGRKHMDYPGFYIEIGGSVFSIYGGIYTAESATVADIRYHIAGNSEIFDKLITLPTFVKYFKEIHGQKNKTLSSDLKEPAQLQPLIYNKQFYFYRTLPVSEIRENPVKIILDHYKVMQPLNDFLGAATGK